jgi:O-antigen/teichoic acid export membrane protein
MGQDKSGYRQIVKATSIFGGVQVFQILTRIIRAKFIAILLGPTGMGIAGLLGSTIQLISGLTNFGLGTSAVKDISTAFASGNIPEVSKKALIVQRWVWITGIIGTVFTLLASSWLSEVTFGNKNYTFAFVLISITLLLNQISTGQTVLLRGTRNIKYLAQASMIGSALGLFFTIPLYYFYKIDGIVPGIILTSVMTLVLSTFYSFKVSLPKTEVSLNRTFHGGKDMLKLGFILSLSGMITLGVSYIVKIFISKKGGVDQVGLYSAGFSIINSYVGMIFTAMSTDYYPRLAGVVLDVKKRNQEINQQTEIAVLILAPIMIFFMVFIKWGIILLYSSNFLPVIDMVLWAILGILFKAGSWALGFLLLAKGERKLYFLNEIIFNAYFLILNIIGFYYLGLKGLGLAFLLSYSIYIIQLYYVANNQFDFSFNSNVYKIFGYQLIFGVSSLLTILILKAPYTYIIGVIFILFSSIYSYKQLDKLLDLKSYLNKFNKNK